MIRLALIALALIVLVVVIKRNPQMLGLLKEAGGALMQIMRFLK